MPVEFLITVNLSKYRCFCIEDDWIAASVAMTLMELCQFRSI